MKVKDKKANARRKFLMLGVMGGATLLTQNANAQGIPEDDDMIPMLTADGQLVHVPRGIVERSDAREQAKNEDILKWSRTGGKSAR